MRKIVFLLLPLLAGCATGPSLKTRMTAYIGAPEETLVHQLGVPDKQISVHGTDYLAYVRSHAQVAPDFADFGFWGPFGPYGGGFAEAGLPRDVQVWRCEITFAVQGGKVTGVTFKGNDCS